MLLLDAQDTASAAKKLKITASEDSPKWICLFWSKDKQFGITDRKYIKSVDSAGEPAFAFGTKVIAKYGKTWYDAVVVFASNQDVSENNMMKLAKKLDGVQQLKQKQAMPTKKRVVKPKSREDFTSGCSSDEDDSDGPTPPPSPPTKKTTKQKRKEKSNTPKNARGSVVDKAAKDAKEQKKDREDFTSGSSSDDNGESDGPSPPPSPPTKKRKTKQKRKEKSNTPKNARGSVVDKAAKDAKEQKKAQANARIETAIREAQKLVSLHSVVSTGKINSPPHVSASIVQSIQPMLNDASPSHQAILMQNQASTSGHSTPTTNSESTPFVSPHPPTPTQAILMQNQASTSSHSPPPNQSTPTTNSESTSFVSPHPPTPIQAILMQNKTSTSSHSPPPNQPSPVTYSESTPFISPPPTTQAIPMSNQASTTSHSPFPNQPAPTSNPRFTPPISPQHLPTFHQDTSAPSNAFTSDYNPITGQSTRTANATFTPLTSPNLSTSPQAPSSSTHDIASRHSSSIHQPTHITNTTLAPLVSAEQLPSFPQILTLPNQTFASGHAFSPNQPALSKDFHGHNNVNASVSTSLPFTTSDSSNAAAQISMASTATDASDFTSQISSAMATLNESDCLAIPQSNTAFPGSASYNENLPLKYDRLLQDFESLKATHNKLRVAYDTLQKKMNSVHEPPVTPQEHYIPIRGIQISKANYIILQSGQEQTLPPDYEVLAGSLVAVPSRWMSHFLSKVKDKSKSFAIKKLLDGLFEPEELAGKNSSSFKGTEKEPLIEAINMFGLRKLNMKSSDINIAVNSRCQTCKRSVKLGRVLREYNSNA